MWWSGFRVHFGEEGGAACGSNFQNCNLFDGVSDELLRGMHVLVADGKIVEVSETALGSAADAEIDASAKTLMPGLIDAHVHITAATPNLAALEAMPVSYVSHWTARLLGEMLDRGFTTVRDVGGGDAGHKRAQAEGLIRGPRLSVSGKALGQTGGHTDFRGTSRTDLGDLQRRHTAGLGRIVDGVPACLAAARDELRLGADFVKIMANGGVATPTDPIDWIQFTPEEIQGDRRGRRGLLHLCSRTYLHGPRNRACCGQRRAYA